MGLFHRPTIATPAEGQPFTGVIQNEGDNTGRGLIAWLHPSKNFNTHSKLVVRTGEEAIFENGASEWAVFPERTECELLSQNIAVIRGFREALSGGQSYFPCRVYFISTEEFEIDWGTITPIGFTCPVIGEGAQMRGHGQYVIKVVDSELFAKTVLRDNTSYTKQDLKEKLFQRIYTKVAAIISDVLEQSGKNAMEVSKVSGELSLRCMPAIQSLLENYGIYLVDFALSLELDEEQRQMYEQLLRTRVMGAKGKVAEMREMGSDYTTIKGMDMLQAIAENPGGLAGAGAGIGMGMAAGSTFGNIAQTVFASGQMMSQQQNIGAGVSQSSQAQPDPTESLSKMKQLLDAGLISQEVYDSKVQEILSRL